ncbi:MAG: putative GTP-binding protein EngB [Bacteroidota bacterium]|nr:MAG: ribosome biogenesis GTP-binding protein YsxC/EngB [Bacteroidetes bacterium OLB12]GIL23387.1 MAG: putative GTP-binding protein EngB [Bacteroidota bacterium]HNR75306.1 ribosome biogenesis GTP-binding protein YihA/YsxC [Cyclobacteriaceae bacterium]HNU42611.1 ribosome biogenesis GTP-binding protein YihA/YsxC [Cyclobacteriaceae bacterium]
MEILQAEFVISNSDASKCPQTDKPEFAFIGRSNVGKSSLINMLTNRKDLAKTSSTPGKTQTINHFLLNRAWYLVDLPGYGYAQTSKTNRQNWSAMIDDYFKHRDNLYCTFILIDSRLEPQDSDVSFINHLGQLGIPIALVFTKVDKLKQSELAKTRNQLEKVLLKTWEELPPIFVTSAEKKTGRKPMLDFIETALQAKR